MRLRVDSDAFTPSQAARGQYGQWRVEQSGGEVGSAKAPGAGHCFGMFWAIVKKKMVAFLMFAPSLTSLNDALLIFNLCLGP